MSWQVRFHSFIAEWMREEQSLDVKRVVSVEQEVRDAGGCETCSYEYTVIIIEWYDSRELFHSSEFTTSFSNLFGI